MLDPLILRIKNVRIKNEASKLLKFEKISLLTKIYDVKIYDVLWYNYLCFTVE